MIYRCPTCRSGQLEPVAAGLACPACGTHYPLSRGRPVLFDAANTMFSADDYLGPARPGRARGRLRRLIPEPSVNLSVDRVLPRLASELAPDARILVVGAGVQRDWLTPILGGPQRTLVCTDVDVHADVDLFCDGHDLPFADRQFDAVVTTAVLEHVSDPFRVAEEITRVTKPGGWLYSELPFIQQVHEGAYDFTRFTMNGHRRLFRWHAEVESGMVAGPGTALAWSIENFVLAFARGARGRAIAKAAARIGFAWLKHFDRLLAGRAEAMDGASCTYLLGRRAETARTDQAIVASYTGAKPYAHT